MQTSSNFYKIEGHKYDRVTRITGCIPKQDILINWAAKITAEAAADTDQKEFQTKGVFIDEVKQESRKRRMANAVRGTEIHGAIEAHNQGDEVVELYRPWVDRADEIMEQYEIGGGPHRGVSVDYEQTLVNVDLGYAGTADLVAPGLILDWKTGRSLYPDYLIQMWAYMNATHWVQEDGTLEELAGEFGFAKPDLGVLAHVQQHEHTTVDLHRDSQLFEFAGETFKHLQGVKRWMDMEQEIRNGF